MSTPQSGAAPRRAPNPRRRAAPRNRSANSAADDTEQVKALRAKYTNQLGMLQELFPDWSDEDLLFVLNESGGEVETAVGRISEGHAAQFASVKTKKQTRKEAAAATVAAPAAPAPAAAPQEPAAPARARTAERSARGRGAPTQSARAGRGGFRGVGGRGGAAGGGPVATTTDTKPITTTAQAFNVSQPSANKERTQEKPKTGMSWAQVARPVEPKPEPPAAVESAAVPSAPAPQSAPEPAIDSEITQPALVAAAAQMAAPEVPASAPVQVQQAQQQAQHQHQHQQHQQHQQYQQQQQAPRARGRAQNAPVVMPGGASALDRLGVQFGSLNFMAGDDGEPLAADEPAPRAERFEVDGKRDESSFQQPNLDAFKSNAFGGNGAYGLGGRPQGFEQAEELPATAAAQAPPAGAFASSSIYNTPLETQRNNLPYGSANTVGSAALHPVRADERASPVAAAAPPPPPALPTHPDAQAQQPFPNVMPYYYPYYMPNQFQHYASPAGGFGQYQVYGGQPQHPSKPEQTPPASLASAYSHHGAPVDTSAVYGTQTPPPHFQPHNATSASYDSQGFGQRMPNLGHANSDFKLQGNAEADAGGLPALTNFLTAGQTPQGSIPPQARGSAQNSTATNSSPLDYRSFDGKSPAGGANRAQPAAQPGAAQPAPQQPAQQQHPAYYQQYAGNFGHQGNAYNGYSYGRQQPYWG